MPTTTDEHAMPMSPGLDRQELLAYEAVFGPTFLAAQGLSPSGDATPFAAHRPEPPRKRYEMRKSINLWAFPYPQKMSLKQCMELAKDAGFDGIEVNYSLEGQLSPDASQSELEAIGNLARGIGIAVSGVCSFLYWPYSLTSNDPERRQRGMDLARGMILAAQALDTENLLVVPGSVYIPWLPEDEPVPNDVCERRAREAISSLLPDAERAGVFLNLENIFANGFLLSPGEMVAFIDSFEHPRVKAHFDTGNIMQYQFPEHWVPILGSRIQNMHVKEYDKRVNEFNQAAFRPLLDGTTNWPAVIEALDSAGYRGYLTFEYFHPFEHWPESLVYQTSDALDRMLGRKA